MRIKLLRLAQTHKATFGVLIHEGIPFALTLERPWKFNQRSVSCIPPGAYRAIRCRKSPDYNGDSPKFGDTFQVYDVPRRGNILFHKGNLEDDTHGCILVGEMFDPIKGRPGIAASRKGFEEFLRITNEHDEFEFTVSQR